MVLMYGEGQKAFVRLQEEILSQREDYSVFAWSSRSEDLMGTRLLASAPSAYSEVRVLNFQWRSDSNGLGKT
ncbi:hypothetical protein M501DRAFT_995016 [Patellaria atrata CBS 101060]|uniref:DUF8212 domain-containing protein n=1 Tax=Patellaria atrata CBS 101060 TaxID=1346257 RepID=A0A9P4VNI9_9PEZI|nr:hypothetical protein M501DRAFT_995016 [Patellaria atrata CBS 101060]